MRTLSSNKNMKGGVQIRATLTLCYISNQHFLDHRTELNFLTRRQVQIFHFCRGIYTSMLYKLFWEVHKCLVANWELSSKGYKMQLVLMMMLVIHISTWPLANCVTLNSRFFTCNIKIIKTLNVTEELIILSQVIYVKTWYCE